MAYDFSVLPRFPHAFGFGLTGPPGDWVLQLGSLALDITYTVRSMIEGVTA